MVSEYLVITILTILIFGTISSFLVSYNYSGMATFSIPILNSVLAAKDQKNSEEENNADSINPAMLKQLEKVKELNQNAKEIRMQAKLAEEAANNATLNAQSLLTAASEADKIVKGMEFSGQKSSSNSKASSNNENSSAYEGLAAAHAGLKEKQQAAKIANKDAKELSDKADVLNKAATKAEKLAFQEQKVLKQIRNNINGTGPSNEAKTLPSISNLSTAMNTIKNSKGESVPQEEKDNKIESAKNLHEKNSDSKATSVDNKIQPILDNSNNLTQGPQVITELENILARAQKNVQNTTSGLQISGESTNLHNNTSALGNFEPLSPRIKGDNNNGTNISADNGKILNFGLNNNTFGKSIPSIGSNNLTGNGSANFISTTTIYGEKSVCKIAVTNTSNTSSDSFRLNINSSSRQDNGGCSPNASTSGQFKYVVWSEGDEDNRFILFKRSTDGGQSFDNTIMLSGNVPSAEFNPKLSSEGNNVYVVWQGDSNSGNQDILMRKSTDNGKSFGHVINLSNDHAGSGNPEISVNASTVYVVWDGTTPGNNEIFYRRSVDNGSNFDSVRNLSADRGVSYEPKIVINKNDVQVYWRDYTNGHENILSKKSFNEGRTFDMLKNINKGILGLWKEHGGLDLRFQR